MTFWESEGLENQTLCGISDVKVVLISHKCFQKYLYLRTFKTTTFFTFTEVLFLVNTLYFTSSSFLFKSQNFYVITFFDYFLYHGKVYGCKYEIAI